MLLRLLTILISIFGPFVALAAAGEEGCPPPSTVKDVLRCADERSPLLRSLDASLQQNHHAEAAAGKWSNPEFALDSVSKGSGGERNAETELALSVPLEIGGAPSSRQDVARAGTARRKAEIYEARAELKIQLITKLHRLRHHEHEYELVKESLATFSKLVDQYSGRPKLSPEQEVAVAVFRMARSDYALKKTELEAEKSELENFFKVHTGMGLNHIAAAVPPIPTSWPDAPEAVGKKNLSPLLQQAEADLSLAQAEYELAKSESWPTLNVGPNMKLQTENGRSEKLYGFNVGFALPLFNVNGAARRAASAGIASAEVRHSLARETALLSREALLKAYRNTVQALTDSISETGLAKRHREIERLAFRGLIPSALIIEAHQQIVELETKRHAHELKAIEMLWKIRTLDGTVLEVEP